MKKLVKLDPDGFVRAGQLNKLLEDGWNIIPTGDKLEIYAEKTDLDEGKDSSPQLLLD